MSKQMSVGHSFATPDKQEGFEALLRQHISIVSQGSKLPASQPKWEWVESLLIQARKSNCKVYFKPNLEVRPKEYPIG